LRDLRRFYRVIGTALERGSIATSWAGARPIALVLGNEETGLDGAVLTDCEEVVTIPGCGRLQSLNVAAAAAILIYLATRP
jgi:RNA methyltransferase, TrmH family